MLFNSFQFFVFFPIVVLFYYLIPHKLRNLWLLVASYFFYMCWNVKYVLILLFSTGITYGCGIMLEFLRAKAYQRKWQKYSMIFCIGANLAILFVFKYFDFALENLNRVLGIFHREPVSPLFALVLPVGISFYIFQAIGYTIDVYRQEIPAERNFLRYALFVSFFPQLVAGPIERSGNLMRQFREEHSFSYERAKEGLALMLWGYFMKLVIADRIAIFVNQVYGNPQVFSGVYLIVATVLFAVQIYCDFAGYSTIAIGAAKVMGFELMENFDAPYLARSVTDFWRRWHISLTSWFRDYLYIPLGGNRKGKMRKYLNVLVVFLISGLWHGASWTFVIWGGLNGFYQILEALTHHKIKSRLLTFLLVDFSWIFFRADHFSGAWSMIKSMLTVHNWTVLWDGSLYMAGLSQKNFVVLGIGIFVLFLADWLKEKKVCVREKIMQTYLPVRYVVWLTAIVGILVFGIWGPTYDAGAFIYFQF